MRSTGFAFPDSVSRSREQRQQIWEQSPHNWATICVIDATIAASLALIGDGRHSGTTTTVIGTAATVVGTAITYPGTAVTSLRSPDKILSSKSLKFRRCISWQQKRRRGHSSRNSAHRFRKWGRSFRKRRHSLPENSQRLICLASLRDYSRDY